jgi:hypothetical protein
VLVRHDGCWLMARHDGRCRRWSSGERREEELRREDGGGAPVGGGGQTCIKRIVQTCMLLKSRIYIKGTYQFLDSQRNKIIIGRTIVVMKPCPLDRVVVHHALYQRQFMQRSTSVIGIIVIGFLYPLNLCIDYSIIICSYTKMEI